MREPRRIFALPLLMTAVVAFAGCVGSGESEEAAEDMEGESMEAPAQATEEAQSMGVPQGFLRRLDRESSDPTEFEVTMDAGEIRIATGPAGILYREEDMVEAGDYTVSATFVEYEAPPGHREAFGIFVGGSGLQANDQSYAYFLIRADGNYLVKSRRGDETSTAVGWTASDAVNMAEEPGMALENELAVSVSGDVATFSVNGTELASVSAAELGVSLHGMAGMRVNHRLNVGVRDWSVERGM